MKYIRRYLIFVMIGIVPNILADYSLTTWQWWVIVLMLDIGVWMRDSVKI